jgi:Superfamily I DNA and RNA helicases
MKEFILCDQRKTLLEKAGHLLVKGGPGSGKTTISLLKAAKIINSGTLLKGQKILFLSFARATVSRVLEDAKMLIPKENQHLLEINTYHGFCWSIIKTYGKLIVKNNKIQLLTPPEASSLFFKMEKEERAEAARKLLEEKGILSFDLFADLSGKVLSRSKKIRGIFSSAYPYIFVDEFQDTNPEEWLLIKQLGETSTIIALADPYQRIYDFRGANPKRLLEFVRHFNPENFDFGDENNRSGDTDIALYGNDILSGENKRRIYNQVKIERYGYFAEPMAPLKYAILTSLKRLKKTNPDNKWSIAILVRSKKLTLSASSYLSKASAKLGRISHEVLIDPSGPSLSAVIIASVLEPVHAGTKNELILSILSHIKGRKDKPSLADIEWSTALSNYLESGKINGSKRQLFIKEIDIILAKRIHLEFSGVPENDWISVRRLFEESTHPSLLEIFEDSKYLRLLNKGALLSSRLTESWRLSQNYSGAKDSIKDALLQEHFSMSHRKWQGIFIMTLHKSKGKEFDEVIIWEDQYQSIVPYKANTAAIEQSKLVLRVGVTRAKKMTTICTPVGSPCILI